MFVSSEGKPGRRIVARLMPDTELMEGIKEVLKKHHIQHANIVGIGSLNSVTLRNPYPFLRKPVTPDQVDIKVINRPLELVSLNGQAITVDGEMVIHLHLTVSAEDGKTYSGHYMENGITNTTVELIIDEITDINVTRVYDESTGHYEITFQD